VVHLSFKECRPHLDAEVSHITNDVPHLNVVHLSFKECRPHLDAEVSRITNDVPHLNVD